MLGKVVILDYRLAQPVRSVAMTQMIGSLTASPDGNLVACGGTGGTVFLIERSTGKWLELDGHMHPVTALHFSPDSTRLVTGGGSALLTWSVRGRFVEAVSDALEKRLLSPPKKPRPAAGLL